MRVSRQRAREEEAALAAATAASIATTPNGKSTRASASQPTPSAATTKTEKPEEKSTLQRLRDMWEFASLMQYIFMFGKVVKIDENFDIEDLETECVKPGPSAKLAEFGLCMLKFVSSHRGLTPDLFDEYTRRQFVAKAPMRNPFGTEEEPKKFNEFDIFTKIRVLHQLSTWTFHNPDRMRERMEEQTEREQTAWRCEELGYDADDRQYYVFDDNRLYRRTEPPIPAAPRAKPKANSKKAKAAARAAKRRKLSMNTEAEDNDEEQEEENVKQDDGTDGGYKWECLAISLQDYQDFLATLDKTKDPNEKILRDSLIEDVMPIIEKLAEKQERKIREKERELINLQKMATAKRSSRLAGKQERERQEQEAAEAEAKHQAELKEAQKAAAHQKKLEQERQNRMQTREQRIKEREHKRILHEEELRKLAEEKEKLESGEGRISERRLKTELEKKKRDLEELEDEEEDWVFDCAGCGMHGQNLDDGQHSLACERCSVWQHSKCLGIEQAEAEKDDFHFVCRDCKRREEDAAKAKAAAIKIRLKPSASPSQAPAAGSPLKKDSPAENKKRKNSDDTDEARKRAKSTHARLVEVAIAKPSNVMNGPMLPPQGVFQINGYGHSPLKQSPSPASNGHPTSQTSTPGFHHQHNGVNGQVNGRKDVPYSTSNATAATPSAQTGPSSSPIMHAASPIQNRPSISPTQGNHDVGPLAGFPPSASMHHPYSTGNFNSPLQQAQMTPSNHQNRISKEEIPNSSFQSPYSSFSISTPSNSQPRNNDTTTAPTPNNNILNTPKHLHAMPLSGLSPTKHSPPRPSTSGSATGTNSNGNGTPAPISIMPPQYNLQPSPKVEGKKTEGLSPRKSPTPQEKKGDIVMMDVPAKSVLENRKNGM